MITLWCAAAQLGSLTVQLTSMPAHPQVLLRIPALHYLSSLSNDPFILVLQDKPQVQYWRERQLRGEINWHIVDRQKSLKTESFWHCLSPTFLLLLIVVFINLYHHKTDPEPVYLLTKDYIETRPLIKTTGHRAKFTTFKTEKLKFLVPWELNNERVFDLTPYPTIMNICIIAFFRCRFRLI